MIHFFFRRWMCSSALLPFLLCLFVQPLFAQFPGGGQFNAAQANVGRFYGKVVDEATGKGIGYASVQLTAMRFDSASRSMKPSVVAGQLTQENGEFSLENLQVLGDYTLKINYLGYATIEQKVSFNLKGMMGGGGGNRPPANNSGNPGSGFSAMAGMVDKDLGNIRLAASSQLLKEVTIQGEAAQVTLALDKKVYRVDKDAIAAGGSAEDALKNVPSLNVDLDGNLTLRNAAPQLFVDGRPTPLTLDQIPADAIESVEVITNPSAKYDASGGGAGIVNIVLKKDRRVGYNGSVRAGVDMRGRVNLGGDINVREGKINSFLSGNFNQRRSISEGQTDRSNLFGSPLTDVFQSTHSVNNGFFAMGRGGIDWFISNRNTLTLAASYNRGQFKSNDDLNILTDTLLSTVRRGTSLRNSDNARNFNNLGSQLLFKHLFPKEGKELTADVNFNRVRSDNEGIFNTSYGNGAPETRQKQAGDGGNEFVTVQTDFTSPLKNGLKVETGARAALRNFRNNNASYQFDYGDQDYVRTPGFADRYQYTDQVYAAYGTFSQSFRQWGYQVGLRAESSFYEGTLLETDSTFGIEYPFQLFPSAFLTYKLNNEDNLQLNVSRRINRPNFFQLIPFPDFSDSLLLSRGNPALLPEFTNSVELSYQNIFNKSHNLLVSVYYKRATDLITRYQFSEYNAFLGRETIVSTFQNSNSSTAYGVEFTLKNTFWKKIDLTSNINLYNSIVDASNIESQLENKQFTYFIKEYLSIKLPQSFTVQVNGSYQSRTAFAIDGGGGGRFGGGGGGWGGGPTSTAQGYSIPVWFVDLSVRKDLWKRTASITLSMQDIFRSRKTGSSTESAFFIQDSWRRRDPQFIRLNFSYRFGKFDVSLFRRKNNRIEMEGMEF
ncbi:MAG: TonB-dependent receptor [Saprospiraceae bacterium]|nr:TonB-dependent receptor [Saprospiraceae bacterium]